MILAKTGAQSYIDKTLRNLRTRLTEHAKADTANSAISDHLSTCDNAKYLINNANLYDNLNDIHTDKPFSHQYFITNNTNILSSLKHSNSNLLLFLEALHIKYKQSKLNNGLKASKELILFP